MVIRHEHLQPDRRLELKEEVDGAGAPSGTRFTKRPTTVMKDNFRLRTPAERINLRTQKVRLSAKHIA